MMHKNQWTDLKLSDVKGDGDSDQKAFEKLRRKANRIQKTLGKEYHSEAMLCDFYRRALQDEPLEEPIS